MSMPGTRGVGRLVLNDDGHVFLLLSDGLQRDDLRRYLRTYCRPGVDTVAYCVSPSAARHTKTATVTPTTAINLLSLFDLMAVQAPHADPILASPTSSRRTGNPACPPSRRTGNLACPPLRP